MSLTKLSFVVTLTGVVGHGAAAITTQLHAPPITILLSHLLLDHTLRPRKVFDMEPDGADTVAITFNDPNALVMAKFETWQTVQRKRNDQITSISYALRSETKVEADDCKFPLFHMV
ncbi:hypothetical protein MUK42_06953 [Musa troglodytarum]|uniref:Uncharacterized protein n=1 Tax=Musa troglodytarum TaxID=320322 RepID=A0A9E7H9K8_9LILI|nr:hypothetical protein MUK42_06953 [Musa troglodytarum]